LNKKKHLGEQLQFQLALYATTTLSIIAIIIQEALTHWCRKRRLATRVAISIIPISPYLPRTHIILVVEILLVILPPRRFLHRTRTRAQMVVIMRHDGPGRGRVVRVVARTYRPPQNASNRQEKVKLLVTDLEQILGIELDRRVAGEVEDALDEAAVLAEDLKGEAATREVVEDAGVVAGDVHAAAEAGQVDVDGGLLGVAAEDDGVGLHVILEVLALELREARLHVAAHRRA